jgi:MSHA biogenesis protein MshE
MLELDEPMTDALRNDDTSAFAHAAHNSQRFRSLTAHALDYALSGVTSLEEVMRVSSDHDQFAENPFSDQAGSED